MKIFLIRHGETVDNIAGNLAGVTDSALTNYGVDQTKQLGKHFAATNVAFTHIFASPLSRAYRTAEAIREEQINLSRKSSSIVTAPEIVKVEELIEQDFGSYEGKPFGSRQSPSKTGREVNKNAVGFVEIETKEAMGIRAERFLDAYLMPIVDENVDPIVAVVSHGMLLSTLWRRILRRIAQKSLSIAPEVTAARGAIILEHPGGWSNTGYLELHLARILRNRQLPDHSEVRPIDTSAREESAGGISPHGAPIEPDTPLVQAEETVTVPVAPVDSTSEADPTPILEKLTDASKPAMHKDFSAWSARIVAIDSRTHLIGLKRQRGGIGRLAHDESQSKLTSFFKKPRTS